MSSPRLARIPFEHLEAELAAFPLASEESFRLGTASLNPQVSRAENDKLWRATERVVLNALPSVPLDEAVTIRDRLWFDSDSLNQNTRSLEDRVAKPVSLRTYLTLLATDYLEQDGNARPVKSGMRRLAPEKARLRWSWLCQALPPDLLRVARSVSEPDGDPLLLDHEMRKVLDRGFAETHLHLGAALDFPLAWAALMRALTSKESRHFDFESPGACFDNGRMLGSWLLHAAVVRLVLGDWLVNGSPDNSSLDQILSFASSRPGSRLDLTARLGLRVLFDEVLQGRGFESSDAPLATGSRYYLERRFAQTRGLYQRLIGPPDLVRSRNEVSLGELRAEYRVLASDPLARVIGWVPEVGSSPETLFTSRALSYLEKVEADDCDFARLFWQLMRIRCLLYRHVVQRPLTPGLQWFVRFFSRIKPLRKNISETVLGSAAAFLSGEGPGFRSLEVRLGTEESESACLQKVRSLERVAVPTNGEKTFRYFRHRLTKESSGSPGKDRVPKFEVGALFHFSRKRGGGWESGKPNAYGFDHSYPGMLRLRPKLEDAGNPTGFRFARFYLEQRRHAQALVSIFQKYPRFLCTVRGVDLCTDEAGIPVWVMAPLVKWVREAGLEAAKQLELRAESKFKIPFRTSVHAGEDFVHLLTGLRRVDEAVTHLALQKGDRLGHALALGEDPSAWCRRVGQIVQTSEERLFDLVWEFSWHSRRKFRMSRVRRRYVKSEIKRLATFVFGNVDGGLHTLEELIEFVRLLHDNRALRDQGFPDRPIVRAQHSRPPSGNGDKLKARAHLLLAAYLGDEGVWRRGRIPEAIDLLNGTNELTALVKLQAALKRQIQRMELTVEVNPSSNLLVGDLGNYMGHPIWNMRPVTRWSRFLNRQSLEVCVGSDDPLTFATRLRHEYQLLCDAMTLRGHSKRSALRWIEDVRKTSMRARFTLVRDIEQVSQGLRVPSLLRSQRPEAPP